MKEVIVNKEARNKILDSSNIVNLIGQNKNVNIIRQKIYKQHGYKLSYSIINRYIKKTFKKTLVDKKWVDIKNEVISAIPPDSSGTNTKELPKEIELTSQELDRKISDASHNLDALTKEEIINYLQTIMKNNLTTLSKITHLEKRFRSIEKKKNK